MAKARVLVSKAAFLSQLGNAAVAPQSFPLIAEIVSPTDYMEEIFAKVQEYLQSGCEEGKDSGRGLDREPFFGSLTA